MRTISLFIAVFLATACMSEVKPYLKQTEVAIPDRIVDQKKWIDQDITAKTITFDDARPVRAKLKEIEEKYSRLQSEGRLTAKDSTEINRMLDETSSEIFRLDQRKRRGVMH